MAIKETTDTNGKLCIRNYKHRNNGHFNLSEKKLVILFIYLATPIVHGISQDSNKLTP